MAQIMETDVLVVGGGGAAARAALEADRAGARVILATKGRFGESGATAFKVAETAGLAASTGDDDPRDLPEGHYQDIMAAAQGMSDPRLSRILAEEAPKMIRDLEGFGIQFLRDAAGNYIRSRGCFSSRALPPRGYNVKDHAHPIMVALKARIAGTAIRVLEKTMVTRILVRDGRCIGATTLDEDGNSLVVSAASVVLGTGGAGQLFALNLNPRDVTGDGYALAYEAGAELANMEFMQAGAGIVHPLSTLLHVWFWSPHPRLTNSRGEEFLGAYVPGGTTVDECMDTHAQHYPFSSSLPSKYIDIGVKKEILGGRGTAHHGVWADFSHLPEAEFVDRMVKSGRDKAAERWAITKEWYRARGVDLLAGPFEMTVFGHAINGGVLIDEHAESSIAGLFACGEAAAGPHGADRLGGNMLVTCQVFGVRAGQNAARHALSLGPGSSGAVAPEEERPMSPFAREGTCSLDEVRREVQWLMWNNALVIRSDESLGACERDLARIDSEMRPRVRLESPRDVCRYLELCNLVQTGKMIVLAARTRRESRGSHYREDYPARDDAGWERSILIRKRTDMETGLRKLGRN